MTSTASPSGPIETVSRAIRFEGPAWLPLELVDVPGIYDAYGTLDPESFCVPAGAESFDSAWATYHWTLEPLGRNERGELLRRDEWGCVQRVPAERTSAYVVETRPLQDVRDLSAYRFPDPEIARPFFERVGRVIRQRYPDRFICAYIDPGPFLVAFNLLGYEGLLTRLADDPVPIRELIQGILEYQKALVPRWKAAGAHMINLIDEFAGSTGMMFSPAVWRREFRPLFHDFFATVREQGLFTGILLDGNIEVLFDDLLEMPVDVVEFAQPLAIGLEKIAARLAGRVCVKASVDMMETLARGTPEAVAREAEELVRLFHSARGGFIAVVLRWHRPEYPAANVRASIDAFNRHRADRIGVRGR